MKSIARNSVLKWLVIGLCVLSGAAMMSGCVSVQEYQMMYLNDEDMESEDPAVSSFETDTEQYREGAAGGNGRKAGGGCGCN